MKKFIAFLGMIVFLVACASEPFEETAFFEFFENDQFLTYLGEETVSGSYHIAEEDPFGFITTLALDEASEALVPVSPLDLEGRRVFFYDTAFREALNIEGFDPSCVYEGEATIKISGFQVAKLPGDVGDSTEFVDLVEAGEPTVNCETL